MGKRRRKVRKSNKGKGRSPKVNLYPVIWCTGEEIAIAVSYRTVGVKRDKFGNRVPTRKVGAEQWKPHNSKFREGYKMDLSQYGPGDVVLCPHCNSKVDFRLFPGTKPPKLVGVSKDEDNKGTPPDELPDTPESEV